MAASTSAPNSVSLPKPLVRVLQMLPQAAVCISARGHILLANQLARLALGTDGASAHGVNLATFLADPPERFARTLQAWSRTTQSIPGSFSVRGGQSRTFDARGAVVVLPAADTPAVIFVRFWLRSEESPFVLLNQKIAELNGEIAHRVRVEEALRQSEVALLARVTEAETLNRAKDEFLATVSHELRTPLNAILGWSSLLKERVTDADVAKPLDVIHRNARSQARIIEDILDVSRIISGKMQLHMSYCDLRVVVEEAVEVVRPSATAKNIGISVKCPTDECLLVADPDRLRQVAWNLLSNAVKFTNRDGRVSVEVGRVGSECELRVADTGRGIEQSFLPFVFDRFSQADSSRTRSVGGLGLGLAVVRHIIELHGGSVAAFSDGHDMGATFRVQLPVRAVSQPAVERSSAAASDNVVSTPATTLAGLRILVVDDEEDARDLISIILTAVGGEVTTSSGALEALMMLSGFRPDVVVSDVGMPQQDGYALMRELRKRHGGIPAIALTAYSEAKDRADAAAAGFTEHLCKPVDPSVLIAAIARVAAAAG